MEKLFDINVRITGFNQVKTDTTTVNFITFDGDCQAPFFTGKILDGDVHRLAGDGSEKGIGAFCIDWAFSKCGNLRRNEVP